MAARPIKSRAGFCLPKREGRSGHRAANHYLQYIKQPAPPLFRLLQLPSTPPSIQHQRLTRPSPSISAHPPILFSITKFQIHQNDWRQIRRKGQRLQERAIVSRIPPCLPVDVRTRLFSISIHQHRSSKAFFNRIPVPLLTPHSRSSKAGLAFPVGRVHRLLRKGNYAQRVGAGRFLLHFKTRFSNSNALPRCSRLPRGRPRIPRGRNSRVGWQCCP
jgi:hypothetical protein